MYRRKRYAEVHQLKDYRDTLMVMLYENQEGLCGICGCPIELNEYVELDHIHPVSRGGDYAFNNLQLAHKRCNSSKSYLTQNEYIHRQIEKQIYPSDTQSIGIKVVRKPPDPHHGVIWDEVDDEVEKDAPNEGHGEML